MSMVEDAPEPRQWRTGDAEPADRPEVTDFDGDLWHWDPQVEQWRHKNDTFHWGELVRAWGPLDEVPVPASPVAPSPTNTTTPGQGHQQAEKAAQRRALAELVFEGVDVWMQQRGAIPCHAFEDAEHAADVILDAGWRPPLPDSETEWAVRRAGPTIPYSSEGGARRAAELSPAVAGDVRLLRREVGPWIEVQP